MLMFFPPSTRSLPVPKQDPSAPPATILSPPASAPSGFNPFAIGRDRLIPLVQAQSLPDTPELEKARAYYQKWQGAWIKGHTKPSPEERDQIEAFTNKLLSQLPALAESEHLRPYDIAPNFYETTKLGTPEYKAHSQTPGTQTLKALALMGLCEHELDIPLGSQIAIPLLPRLMGRTPFDSEVLLIYSRFSLDANQNTSAWQSLTVGMYLDPSPSRANLEFAAFVGFRCVKDQWVRVQAMIRELAPTSDIANEVIAKFRPWYEGNNAKSVIVPAAPASK